MTAFIGFDAYCGTYQLVLEEGAITHHVETSRFPNWEGSEQVRYLQVSENRLIIETPPIQIRDMCNRRWGSLLNRSLKPFVEKGIAH